MNLDDLKAKMSEMYTNSPWLSRLLVLFGFFFTAFIVYKAWNFWRKPKAKKEQPKNLLEDPKAETEIPAEAVADAPTATPTDAEPSKDGPPAASNASVETPKATKEQPKEEMVEEEEDDFDIDLQGSYSELIADGRTPDIEELEAFLVLFEDAPKKLKAQLGSLKGAATRRLGKLKAAQ